jgi:acyl-CoA synthetase (AMP-forming)/AMP-acid ligase II
MVVDPEGDHVVEGEGELCVTGPAVMAGYWGRPRETESVFIATDSDRWYRTGDLVRRDEHGTYLFLGRRDRMVKRRGFRVELGEIEVGLGQHPEVSDVAVVAATDDESGVVITAYLVCPAERPSLIELRRFCATELPSSLAPDRFLFLTELPRTSTGKVDYRGLEAKSGAE